MKIGIVGLGFVGLTFASVLANKGYNVIGVDTDKIKIKVEKNDFIEAIMNSSSPDKGGGEL